MKHSNDWIWWAVIILLLCSATPVGLIALFIYLGRGKDKPQKQIPAQTGQAAQPGQSGGDLYSAINKAAQSAGSAVDEAMRTASEAVNRALGGQAQPAQQPPRNKTEQRQYELSRRPHRPRRPLSAAAAKAKTVCGALMAGSFSLAAVIDFLRSMSSLLSGGTSVWDVLGSIIPLSVFACLGGILALWGHFGTEKVRRFERYQNLIRPGRAALSVHAVADALELRYSRVCDELQEMIDRGYFAFAYLDRSKGLLVLSPDYVDDYVQLDDDPPAAEPAQSADGEDNETLRRIRAVGDAIANPELSAKLDEIEQLTRKMYRLLDERPEKAEALHSFTSYYLPQTLKITETYARMEAQGVEGENISLAKQKIADALDKLAAGYRQQLDQLFEADVVDITADIAVMEQMLARDGLAGEELQPEKRK